MSNITVRIYQNQRTLGSADGLTVMKWKHIRKEQTKQKKKCLHIQKTYNTCVVIQGKVFGSVTVL